MLIAHRRRSRGDDGGFAVVIALLITAIAYLIMTAVLAQAIHNIVLAGHGRRRLAAVNAAESGLNWYANLLSTSSVATAINSSLGWTIPSSTCWNSGTSIPNTCWYVLSPDNATARPRVTVANRPETATFELRVLLLTKNPCTTTAGAAAQCGVTPSNITVQPTVWNGAGAVVTQGILKAQDTPTAPWPDTAYMVVRSTGIVGTVRRTLESYVRLRAVRTSVPGGFLAEAICLGNAAKFIVRGDFSIVNQASATTAETATAFDSDCRTGNVEVGSGDEFNLEAYGSAGGTLSIGGGGLNVLGTRPLSVARNVHAAGAVTLGSGSMASSCPANGQCVDGDVLGQTVLVGSNAYVAGSVIQPASAPVFTFPTMTWSLSQWQSPWNVETVTGTTGLLDAMEAKLTPTVFRVVGGAPGCNLAFDKANASGGEILLKTRIAVVSECQFTFNGASADILAGTSDAALLLISAIPAGGVANCGSPTRTSIGPQDVEINQNPTIKTAFFVYTPCFLWLGNNQNPLSGGDFLQGQFATRFIVVDQSVTLTQVNIGNFVSTLPGQLTGFKQDVRFVREISTTIASGNLPL